MLYLAQVEKKELSGEAELQLIARQRSEYAWTVITEQDRVCLDDAGELGTGALVLVHLSETRQILRVENAKDWILNLIQTFLISGITPAFLQTESERAEQWRQTLTLQSQDLDRRALELEARREQIEQLEENLRREKKQMESLAAQYKEQNQELDQRTLELETSLEEIKLLEESLRYEKKQMEEMMAQYEKMKSSN